MPATISWLDTTPEEQRLARDLISLFSQTESRDELGIGQIRDAFSDSLFPGTSVIQARARYFLFIPWSYTTGSARGTSGARCRAKGESQERRMIQTFLDAGFDDSSGLIGSRVGPAVKTLPSTIYWAGMSSYGVVSEGASLDHLGLAGNTVSDSADELAERVAGDWHAGIPSPPLGFPDQVEGGFAMTYGEASWLAERMVTSHPNTLLAYLVNRKVPIDESTPFPWNDVDVERFPELFQSFWFSNVMHGAALLYNLLLAEAYDDEPELTRLDSLVAHYQRLLEAWEIEFLQANEEEFRAWDTSAMWSITRARNPRIHPASEHFVNAWIASLRAGSFSKIADNQALRDLVSSREKRKQGQSRLLNKKMLATWSGAAGSNQLNFRWPIVTRTVNDIKAGLANAGA